MNIKRILQIFISATLIAFLVYQVDWTLVKSSLKEANYNYMLISIGLITLNRIIMSIKWNMLLRVKNIIVPWFEITKIYYISNFLGLVLPATVGADLIRVFYVSKKQHSKTDILASIVVERIIGFNALFIFGIFGILSFVGMLSNVSADINKMYYLFLASMVIGVGLFFLSFNKTLHKLFFVFLGKFKDKKIIGKIIPLFQNLLKSYESYKNHKLILFGFFILTLLEIFTVILWGYTIAVSLNVEVELAYFAAFVPMVLVLIRLPISLDGFGIHEGAYVYFLGLVGIAKTLAFSVGFINHLVTILGILPGGIFYALSDLKYKKE